MTQDPHASEQAPPADEQGPKRERTKRASDAILPFGVGERLDDIAQDRFNRTDWIELAAAVLLALATIVAAWSAYQATRWGGVQANAYSAAAAARTEATQQNSIYAAQVQIDVMMWIEYIKQEQADQEAGTTFLEDRFREEFKPALEEWSTLVPPGEAPPGTPFDLDTYEPESERLAKELNAQADALSAQARDANQTGDNFVLVAVVMASVLFFAGVGTKLKGRAVRLMMLLFGSLLFLGGIAFMLSMPQNFGV